jgi:hypothetical protein
VGVCCLHTNQMWTINVDRTNYTKWKHKLKVKGKKLPSEGTTMSPWWNGRAGRGPLAGARTRRGERLANQSQTTRGTRAEGEDSWEGSAPSHDPSTLPSTTPCTRSQEQSYPSWSRARRPRTRQRSSEHGGSGTSSPCHPAKCRTTRTQIATIGTPRIICRLSPTRRHLLGNQPAKNKIKH